MRALLGDVLRPTRYNVATAVVVVGLLLVAYVVYPDHSILQYGVWLVIFTIWMTWFVYVGVDHVYDIGS